MREEEEEDRGVESPKGSGEDQEDPVLTTWGKTCLLVSFTFKLPSAPFGLHKLLLQ